MDLPVVVPALPYRGVGVSGRPHIRGLEKGGKKAKQVASIGFRSGDLQEVEHVMLLSLGARPHSVLLSRRDRSAVDDQVAHAARQRHRAIHVVRVRGTV